MKDSQLGSQTAAARPSVAAVVVNYGTATLSLDAVASILSQEEMVQDLQVHLVDNASLGDDAAYLDHEISARGWSNRVTLWREATNHGFGRANTLVLRHISAQQVRPDYVLFLNPDATLSPDALGRLVADLGSHPEAAVVGASLLTSDGAPGPSVFRFPTAFRVLVEATAFGPLTRRFPKSTVAIYETQPEGEVDWVSGAAFLARLDALNAVDFFHPGFFLYFEEVDLMRRLHTAGWRVRHQPAATARHIQGAATGIVSSRLRRLPAYWYHSWLLYHWLRGGRPTAFACALCWLIGAGLNATFSLLRGRRPGTIPHFLPDLTRYVLLPIFSLKGLPDG